MGETNRIASRSAEADIRVSAGWLHKPLQAPATKSRPARVDSVEECAKRKPPSFSPLHDEIVSLRLILKAAIRHEWLAIWRISPRPIEPHRK
jgi:hypothetical protein